MVKTNCSTLHTVYNIQQSATQDSNDITHGLSRRTAATTRFSPKVIGCQKQTAPWFCQHPIRRAFTSQAFTRWCHRSDFYTCLHMHIQFFWPENYIIDARTSFSWALARTSFSYSFSGVCHRPNSQTMHILEIFPNEQITVCVCVPGLYCGRGIFTERQLGRHSVWESNQGRKLRLRGRDGGSRTLDDGSLSCRCRQVRCLLIFRLILKY